MKKLVFLVWLAVAGLGTLTAQRLNDKGLYVVDNGSTDALFNSELFSGVISENKNGLRSEFTVKEGVVEGIATYYYTSGKPMESGTFTKGLKDQKWVRYNENGSILGVAFYNLGKKTGTWLVFDDNGKKRFEMNYTDGEKTGTWTSWDETGAVASVKDYSKLN